MHFSSTLANYFQLQDHLKKIDHKEVNESSNDFTLIEGDLCSTKI